MTPDARPPAPYWIGVLGLVAYAIVALPVLWFAAVLLLAMAPEVVR